MMEAVSTLTRARNLANAREEAWSTGTGTKDREVLQFLIEAFTLTRRILQFLNIGDFSTLCAQAYPV